MRARADASGIASERDVRCVLFERDVRCLRFERTNCQQRTSRLIFRVVAAFSRSEGTVGFSGPCRPGVGAGGMAHIQFFAEMVTVHGRSTAHLLTRRHDPSSPCRRLAAALPSEALRLHEGGVLHDEQEMMITGFFRKTADGQTLMLKIKRGH